MEMIADRAHRFSTIAYFSMEIGLESALPTYSGGLGVLAGDTLRAAADLGVPMVGVTLLHRKGYFRQRLDALGNQCESPSEWSPEGLLQALPATASVVIQGRPVRIRAWGHVVRGVSGYEIPLYFLDTSLPENAPEDRALTDSLYGGDLRYRLSQEAVLGLGGIAMLRALGFEEVHAYHMNEGHSALLTLALLKERADAGGLAGLTDADRDAVRQRCVFTTHTPVPAGHDQFPIDLARDVLGDEYTDFLQDSGCCLNSTLNMTYLALSFSRFVNGVAMRHGQISRGMFPDYPINSITNGVHAATWVSPPFEEIFDRYIPEWRHENLNLRYAVSIPLDEIREAHRHAKRQLIAEVERRTGVSLDEEVLTIGFARRAAAYKRADLLFSDPDRLRQIARYRGRLQVVYGGKAHPHDECGKEIIRRVFEAAASLRDTVPVVYLEEHDMAIGKVICAGVDVWLNTPQKPYEASGTSGMKAALNGVPSLSVLDGWWIEGHVEGITGWSIGDSWHAESTAPEESLSLYEKLEHCVLPTFYSTPTEFARVMRSAIALNGSFFNAQRMVLQYLENAYRPARGRSRRIARSTDGLFLNPFAAPLQN